LALFAHVFQLRIECESVDQIATRAGGSNAHVCCTVLYRTQVLELRKREMRYVFWELMHWAGYISILIVFPIFAMTVTFATYAEGMLSLEGRDESLAAPAPAPAPVAIPLTRIP
jgi:hypothetical protein